MTRSFCLLIPLLGFFPLRSAAAQPAEQVIAKGYHAFPNALPGKTLTIRKIWDPKTQTIKYASDNAEIRNADAWYALQLEDRRLERQKFGALTGRLKARFSEMKDEDRVRVIVVLKYPEAIKHPSKLENPPDVLERHSRQLLDLQPAADMDAVFLRNGMGKPTRLGKREGLQEMTKYQLRGLMFDKDVAAVEEYVENSPSARQLAILPSLLGQTVFPPFSGLARSAYNHSNSPLPAGAGNLVKAATFEFGLDQAFLNCIGITPVVWTQIPPGSTLGDDSLHSLQTFRCLTYAAPNAKFYHNLSTIYFGEGAFLINNGIQTVSMSMDRIATRPDHPEYREMDDFAYKLPYPVFSHPAGNMGWAWETGWQSYNSISVGNVQHRNQTTFRLPGCDAECTQTRNPQQLYGGSCLRAADARYTYCSSDREMPQIVAPGATPTVNLNTCESTPMREPCLGNASLWCGTSYSAPIANGIAADVIAADSRMFQWPEKVRAALMATAENVELGEWTPSFDGRDGTGVINGASAVDFAKTHVTVSANQSAVQKGIGVGQIDATNWGSPLVYNIAVPSSIPSGKLLRVVLTWDSNPTLSDPAVNELSDLDLSVTSTLTTKSSASFNSNVEIVNFASSDLKANTTLKATINKFTQRIPGNATSNFFYYCIAWTWVDVHAP